MLPKMTNFSIYIRFGVVVSPQKVDKDKLIYSQSMDTPDGLLKSTYTSGKSYKHFALVKYNSRLIITSKMFILTTLESSFTCIEAL